MRGFIIYSCFTTIVLIGAFLFVVRDIGLVPTILLYMLAGTQPVLSAIFGIVFWCRGELDEEVQQKKVLSPF